MAKRTGIWLLGVRAVAPILLGVAPFGLIFGVTAAGSGVESLPAWASSFVIFAGAAQLGMIDVLASGGAPVVAVLTAIIINSRMLMYSADVARYSAHEPLRITAPLAYLLTDQAYLVSVNAYRDPDHHTGFISFYFGAALTLWTTWQATTTAGFLLGSTIPASWSLEFAIPLTFLAMLIFAVRDKPGLVAAAVGGLVATAAIGLPYNTGLLVGALSGILAGVTSERWFA